MRAIKGRQERHSEGKQGEGKGRDPNFYVFFSKGHSSFYWYHPLTFTDSYKTITNVYVQNCFSFRRIEEKNIKGY